MVSRETIYKIVSRETILFPVKSLFHVKQFYF